jgi:hypothetical protein
MSKRIAIVLVMVAIAGCSQATPSAPAGSSAAGGQPGSSAAASAGQPGSSTSANAGQDACSLLTADEIKSATGLAFTAFGDPALKDGKECNWQLEPGQNEAGIAFKRFVDVSIFGQGYFDAAAAASGEPVQGIGDKAVLTGGVLVVLKAGRSFAMDVSLHDVGSGTAETTAKENDAELTLAKLVAGRF